MLTQPIEVSRHHVAGLLPKSVGKEEGQPGDDQPKRPSRKFDDELGSGGAEPGPGRSVAHKEDKNGEHPEWRRLPKRTRRDVSGARRDVSGAGNVIPLRVRSEIDVSPRAVDQARNI